MTNEQNLNQVNPEGVKDADVNKENVSNVTETAKQPEQEKVLKQSEVDNLIGITRRNARQEGYDRAKADIEKQSVNQPQQVGQPPQATGQQQFSEENVRKLIGEEAQKLANYQEAQRISDSLITKLSAAKSEGEHADFDETIAKLKLHEDAYIAAWANDLPNTADVLYEMGKSPSRYAAVINLVHSGKAELAVDEMRKLSNSSIQNNKAKEQQFPSDPLGQIKPTASGADNGSLSVSELRKQPYMRV